MARHRGPVLVDTNVILECWRTNAWRALASGYQVETVEDCVIETQTGYQKRRAEQQIEQATLQKSLAAVHKVSDAEKAAAVVRELMFSFLDPGEQSLWAHAVGRTDDGWILCGPDKASLRFGIRLGFRERLVALESLLRDAGHNASGLRPAYTSAWLAKTLGEIVIMEGHKKP
jgi:hypothetical protein